MATAHELILKSQIEALRLNAELFGWRFEQIDALSFVIELPVKDDSRCALKVRCDEYPERPPAWHWFNRETNQIDQPHDTAIGGTFLHSNGVICAPWNRLAYKEVDPRGPHSDWTQGSWMNIKETGGTKTLAAMADRIAHELLVAFEKRMG